jgi:hypothetical protein
MTRGAASTSAANGLPKAMPWSVALRSRAQRPAFSLPSFAPPSRGETFSIADRAEVAETPEVRHEQRRIRRPCRGRGRQRRDPRLALRDGEAFLQRRPFAPRFEVAGHEDDPEVDAVPRDDREQEPRRHVQVPDRQLGQPEGPRDADPDRQRHRDQRAEPQVIEQHHQHEQDAPGHPDLGQIGVDRRVFREPDHQIAGEPVADRGVVRLRIDTIDDLAHAPQRLVRLVEVAAEHARADRDDERLAVLRLVIAVREALRVLVLDAERLADRLRVDLGRLLVVEAEVRAGRLRDLVFEARVDVGAQLLQRLEVREQPGAWPHERDRIVYPVLDRADPWWPDLRELRHERVRRLAHCRRVVAFEHDEDGRYAGRPLRDAIELLHALAVLRQHRLEPGPHLEPPGEEHARGRHERDAEQHQERTPHLHHEQPAERRGDGPRERPTRDLGGRRSFQNSAVLTRPPIAGRRPNTGPTIHPQVTSSDCHSAVAAAIGGVGAEPPHGIPI